MAPTPAPEPSSKSGSGGLGGSSGGVVSSSPTYPWPFQPHQASLSPSPEPSVGSLLPNKSGGMSFINSNPAVPLPTGEVDSATIRPIPTSGHHGKVPHFLCFHLHCIAMSGYASFMSISGK